MNRMSLCSWNIQHLRLWMWVYCKQKYCIKKSKLKRWMSLTCHSIETCDNSKAINIFLSFFTFRATFCSKIARLVVDCLLSLSECRFLLNCLKLLLNWAEFYKTFAELSWNLQNLCWILQNLINSTKLYQIN